MSELWKPKIGIEGSEFGLVFLLGIFCVFIIIAVYFLHKDKLV